MKYSLAAELLLAGTALGKLPEISIEKRDKHNHGRTKNVARGFVKRQDNTLETTVFSGVGYVSGGAYYANVTVGTPPQLQVLLLDTGSSDMYLDASSSAACQSSGPHSCVATDFTPGKSSTYEVVEEAPAFNASYGDGSTATGPYVQDTVCIDDICLDNVQFGLATEVDSAVGPSIGLLGVGYSYGEAVSDGDQFYPNIPDALTAAGVINSRLYSLYLNDYSGVTGSILFGGIDTGKYTGDLETVNMLPDPQTGYVDRFITVVTGLKTSANGNSHTVFSGGATGLDAYRGGSGSLPVLLDSGSSAWSVPSSVFLDLVNQFDFIDSRSGFASCNDVNEDDHITVTFDGSIDIDVPITEWVTPVYDPKTGELGKLTNGEPACAVGIIPSSGTGLGFDTMGDAVMRSMYIVYDLDNGQMSLAQANTDSSSSSVKAVPAGEGGVQKVAKNYEGTSPNSFTILPSVSATENFSPSMATSAVGTATGIAAVPTEAQVQGLGSDSSNAGSGSGSGGDDNAASHGFDSTALWFTGAAAAFAVLGAGLLL